MPGNNAPLILIFFSFQIIIHLSSHKFLISLFYVLMMNSDPKCRHQFLYDRNPEPLFFENAIFFLFFIFEFKPF